MVDACVACSLDTSVPSLVAANLEACQQALAEIPEGKSAATSRRMQAAVCKKPAP